MAKILIVETSPASGSSSARIYNMRAMRARKPVTALPPVAAVRRRVRLVILD